MVKKNNIYEFIGESLVEEPPPPPKKTKAGFPPEWRPTFTEDGVEYPLTSSQSKLYDSNSKYILCWSEKFSAKTTGILHKLVKHCYRNKNALAIIGVKVRSMANKGGAWDKLETLILPAWAKKQEGFEFTKVYRDSQKNEFRWITNRHGGWSKVVLISAPHAGQLKERIPGYEPSFVFWDELTKTDSEIYFSAVDAQIGRNQWVDDVQQYVAACNPVEPEHWVYQKWFVNAFDEELAIWDTDFENIYFPVSENPSKRRVAYIKRLEKTYRDSPIEAARNIGGEWKAAPSGDSLFGNIFNEQLHVRPLASDGSPDKKNRIMPHPDYPIIIGLDPGAVYNVFIFMQWMPIEFHQKWVVFDEMAVFKKRISYPEMIPAVMRRIKFWREEAGKPFKQIWIADSSAFNVYRPGQGSYDVMDMEKVYQANREKYGLEAIKIKQAPKFNGSVKARIRLLQQLLTQEEFIVSTACPKVKNMLILLESEKQKEGAQFDPDLAYTPLRCDWLHVFDAMTYPMLTATVTPRLLQAETTSGQMLISSR